MAKITFKLDLKEGNFAVIKETENKLGFIIESCCSAPFSLSHEDFEGWLLDTYKMPHEVGAYVFICNDDASHLDNLVSEFLTLKFNSEATVIWPFVDIYTEAREAPTMYEKMSEREQFYLDQDEWEEGQGN